MKWLTRVGLSALTFAIGALTLGISGQAGAQDQIPAPNLYDGATDCTTPVASQINRRSRGTLPSFLEAALDGFGAITTPGDLVGVVTAGAGCDDNAVASQFDKAQGLYDDAAAAKALVADEDPDPVSVMDYNEKKAARDAFGGPVYDAVYTQYDRRASATKAINDYNDVVADTTGTFTVAKTQYDALQITAANPNLVGYTADTGTPGSPNNDEVIGDFGGASGVEGFQDINGAQVFATFTAALDATTGAGGPFAAGGEFTPDFLTALGNGFTTGGTMRLALDTSGATPVADVSDTVLTLGNINTYLNRWNQVVQLASRHVTEGTRNEVSNLAELQERLRRVTSIRDHVQREQRRLTNVLRAKNYSYDHDSSADTADVAVTSVLRTYDSELGKRNTAADRVRSAVTALENARNAIHAAMKSPGSFLQQVVDLRTYEDNEAQALLAEFDPGDAPTSVSEAAEDAAMALTRAQNALQSHLDLVGSADNPASALLQALLEDPLLPNGMTNPADDDGQALIDAISTTYSTAEAAKEAADAAAESVSGLTGEDGTIADIQSKLAAKKEYIETLAGEIGINPMTGEGTANEDGDTRIDMNEARSMANAGAIATNAGNIATNAENIATNAGHIAENRGMIEANSGMIMMNSGNITANAENIMANSGNIAANAAAIEHNHEDIVESRGMIEANAGAIAANNMYIMENAGAISQNASMIGANAGAIAANASRIDANVMAIRELREDMSGGIAAAMALAGMPEIGDRGVAVGAGSYDGESAVAVGVHFSGENSRFKAAITSGGGETGVSVGGGWSF